MDVHREMYNRKGKNNPMFHKTPSPETCRKISIAVKKTWAKKKKELEEEQEEEEKRKEDGNI